MSDEERGFSIRDKRRFDAEGNARGEEPAEDTAAPAEPTAQALPALDFSTFVLSLGTSAMVHLGQGPEGSEAGASLPLAKQTIDILGLLQEKTRGNLTDEERELLENLLYDLRLRYVAAAG